MSAIRNILSEIRRAFDTCRRNREIVHRMSQYLQKGVYRNTASGDSVYLAGSNEIITNTYSSHKKMPSVAKGVVKII